MNSNYVNSRVRLFLGLSLVLGVAILSSATVQGQYPWGRDRRGYHDSYRIAQNQGYQDGLNIGASDARQGQNYSPQRSRFYRNATNGYDPYYADVDAYRQAYRDGFLRGYQEGYQRYGGSRGRNGRWFRLFGR